MNTKQKILFVACFLAVMLSLARFGERPENIFSKPYTVEIESDHQVNLIHEKDTIYLYLENAYNFNEEIVYIKCSKH